jgi:hypothetical protein
MLTRILAEGFLLAILLGAVVLFYKLIFKMATKEDAKKDAKSHGSE